MKPRTSRNIVLTVLILAVAGGAAAILIRYKQRPPRKEPPVVVPKVVVTTVAPRRDYVVKIVGYGSARPHVRLPISPEVRGRVVSVAPNFQSGMYVAKGDVLFEIDRTDYEQARRLAQSRIDDLQAQLDQLKIEEDNQKELAAIEAERVRLAEDDLKRTQESVGREAASRKELDQARESLLLHRLALRIIKNKLNLFELKARQLSSAKQSAQVELDKAETALNRCLVKSPFNGRVLSKKIEKDQYVQLGSSCGEIYGTDVMEVPVSLPAEELDWLDKTLLEKCKRRGKAEKDEAGERVRQADSIAASVEWFARRGGKWQWNGCVDRIEAGLEKETRTATLVVLVKNAPPQGAENDSGRSDPPAAAGGPPAANQTLDINMFCKVTIFGQRRPEIFMLPRSAIQPESEVSVDAEGRPRVQNTVYVVEGGRLAMRTVYVARFTDNHAMILPNSGIKAGDRVVTSILSNPLPNMRVEAAEEAPEADEAPPAGAPAATAASR